MNKDIRIGDVYQECGGQNHYMVTRIASSKIQIMYLGSELEEWYFTTVLQNTIGDGQDVLVSRL